MSLLDKLDVGSDVEGQNEDFIPGGNFVLDTGIYPMTIELAYMGESRKGALNVTAWFKEVDGNRTHRETFYVTSGKEKGQSNTYTDKRSGKKRLLPGMEAINQLAVITTGQPLSAQTPAAKTVKLWDFEERKELPKEVPVLTDMLQKPVLVCVTKRRENKRQNVGGDWVDTNEDRVFNEASKFLYPSGHSVAEKNAKGDADYRETWVSKFGPEYVNDRYQAVDGGAVASASSAAAEENSAEVDSLFGEDNKEAA